MEFVEQYGDGKIRFVPQNYLSRKEAWKLYVGNCYVYPTLLDSWANTVYEALSTGMPAIVSDIPIFREALDDKCVWWLDMYYDRPHHGLGAPSIEDIGSAMLYAYEHRQEVRAKGEYGARYVREHYTWEGCITEEFLPVMQKRGYI